MTFKISIIVFATLISGIMVGINPFVSAQTTTTSSTGGNQGNMHLDAGIKALQSGDTNGALMHLQQSQKSQWINCKIKVKLNLVNNVPLPFSFI